ncbi:FG-GAP-like repeat-containing protein [Rhodopila sp.]|uniref:FG-GAP-like repeat-containing protein n=1 Tax=Rhodopila sp. TaxID=2480087 RepID=UPI003D13FAB6
MFNPTPHQVAPGQSVTTGFTISDTDAASAHTTNSATTVIATSGTVLPTISGAMLGQAVTAPATITPFSAVNITDLNYGQVETVTVTLSAPANGTLTNLGGGTYSSGIYTVTGTAAAVTGALHGLVFTPTPNQVAPGLTATTSFVINDIDTASARATSVTASVIATAGTIAPTITGTTALQTVGASGTITPFSNVVIGEVNIGQTETVTVALSFPANGTLTNLGGFSNPAAGIYTYTGSAAAVSAALNGLIFAPTPHQVQPGQAETTVFSITDIDTAGASVVNNTTSVIAIAGTVAPTITGVVTGQTVAAGATIAPFAGVVIGDLNVGQTETVTLSAAANGTLTNLGGLSPAAAPGVYTDVGPAATVTRDLNGLVFNPAAHQVAPGRSVTTVFTIGDTDSASAVAVGAATSVIAMIGAVAPTISGTVAGQMIAAPGMIRPFANVVVADLNFGQTETLTVTLSSAANGFLSNLGSGSYNAGVFTDIGSAAAVTADIHNLNFSPAASLVAHGQTVTTGFTIRDIDSAAASAVDNTTSVTATAGIDANPASLIMLQNSSGQMALWQINGLTIAASGLIGPSAGSSWFAIGAGVFYPGDTSDIVLQSQSGPVETWQVRGTAMISGDLVANPGSAWHIRGTGDFYGDGATDIVLQNDDGSIAVWEAQGGALVNAGIVAQTPGPAWHVVGTGDFYRDGKTDILLQNDDGSVAIWEMQGSTINLNKAGVIAPSIGLGPAWHIKGTGDFYGDGATDIVLQNDAGPLSIWEMQGTTIAQAGFVTNPDGSTANPGAAWHVMGTGDFNNGGKTGIVLQNDNGDVAEWQLSGTTVVSAAILASPGLPWSVFGSGDGMRFIQTTGPNEILAATPTNPDEFVFTNAAAGWHTITGFSAIQDRIELSALRFPAFANVQQAITPIAGGIMINLGNGAALQLPGVNAASLHASNFALT